MRTLIICLICGILTSILAGIFPKYVLTVSSDIITSCAIMMSFSVAVSIFLISKIEPLKPDTTTNPENKDIPLSEINKHQNSQVSSYNHLAVQKYFFYFSLILIVLMIIFRAIMSSLPDDAISIPLYARILSIICGMIGGITFSLFAQIPQQIQSLHNTLHAY